MVSLPTLDKAGKATGRAFAAEELSDEVIDEQIARPGPREPAGGPCPGGRGDPRAVRTAPGADEANDLLLRFLDRAAAGRLRVPPSPSARPKPPSSATGSTSSPADPNGHGTCPARPRSAEQAAPAEQATLALALIADADAGPEFRGK
ncbi:hypothetical protein ACWGDX_05560 [Streptomyces sp. NPDC055025]